MLGFLHALGDNRASAHCEFPTGAIPGELPFLFPFTLGLPFQNYKLL